MWNKYGARKTYIDGIAFDSRKEANRYVELSGMVARGEITDLTLQPKYTLIPSQYVNGKCAERQCDYVADFRYQKDGETIVEDVKGVKTKDYVIKRKLMLERYGIRVQEV